MPEASATLVFRKRLKLGPPPLIVPLSRRTLPALPLMRMVWPASLGRTMSLVRFCTAAARPVVSSIVAAAVDATVSAPRPRPETLVREIVPPVSIVPPA